MSVRVISKVFRESKSTGVTRLVLLGLADVASDSGEVTAYPRSHSVLARKANCGEGSVRRAIRTLEELGEVEVLVVGDGRTKSDYRIILPGLSNDEDARPARAPRTPRGAEVRAEGVQDGPPVTPSLSVPFSSFDVAADAARADPPVAGRDKGQGTRAGEIARNDSDPARAIVDFAWARRREAGKPAPTVRAGSPYMALLAVTRKLLDAGHPAELIGLTIFDHDSAWTNDSLLVTLGKVRAGKATDPRLAQAIRDKNVDDEIRRIREA